MVLVKAAEIFSEKSFLFSRRGEFPLLVMNPPF